MTQLFSLEFLLVVLCIINVVMFIILGLIVKRMNRMPASRPAMEPVCADTGEIDAENRAAAKGAAREITDLLGPLVAEAKNAAVSFDEQIREKRRLTKTLNDALDSRIISINLLLSRSETLYKKLEAQQKKIRTTAHAFPSQSGVPQANVMDQQNQIIDLYLQDMDIDAIARKLSIPKGEVQLVIDLKEKFMAMEQA